VGIFRRKFWVGACSHRSGPEYGATCSQRAPLYTATSSGSHLFPAIFGTAAFLVAAWVLSAGARARTGETVFRNDTLICAGDYRGHSCSSAAVELGFPGNPLWENSATLVTIMLLAHWIEMRSISQASGALEGIGETVAGHGGAHQWRRASRRPCVPNFRDGDVDSHPPRPERAGGRYRSGAPAR